jgi:RNA polymerase sigma-70 factor (sigma-E family)
MSTGPATNGDHAGVLRVVTIIAGERVGQALDRDEFDAFVRARTPALLRTAYLLTGDQQLAEDLVQTALAKTSLAWHRLQRNENAEAYVRQVMYHQQVSWWRRRRVAEMLSGAVPETPIEPGAEDRAATRLAVHSALMRLTPSQRAVLVLRYFDDQPDSVVADLLGISVGTVKSQTHKALAKLRAVAPELAEFHPREVQP